MYMIIKGKILIKIRFLYNIIYLNLFQQRIKIF